MPGFHEDTCKSSLAGSPGVTSKFLQPSNLLLCPFGPQENTHDFFFFLPMILLNRSTCQNRKVWWLPWHHPSLLPSLLSPPVQDLERCGNMSHPLHLHPSTSVADSGQSPAVLLITCKTHRFQTSQESITQE